MQTVTFGYDQMRTISSTFLIAIVAAIFISVGFFLNNPYEWLAYIIAGVIAFSIGRFFILNFTLPMIQGKPALLLDNEKFISNVQDETIYWKDVTKFSKDGGVLTYRYFTFEMKNGEIIRINTKWVDGSTKKMFDNINNFMEQISLTN